MTSSRVWTLRGGDASKHNTERSPYNATAGDAGSQLIE
jgi:hypothetical protein